MTPFAGATRWQAPAWTPSALLLAATAVWGWTFVVVKEAILLFPPLPFLAVRFGLAAAALAVTALALGERARTGVVGVGIGGVLALGYLLQTVGLQTTSPANAGLLTGLFVVFVPVLDRLTFGARLWPGTLVAIGCSLIGTVLLTGSGGQTPRVGDLLMVGAAFAFAWHIVLLSRLAAGRSAIWLTVQQLVTGAALFTAGTALTGQPLLPIPGGAWAALLVTALGASAAGFWVQTLAQQRLSASRAALLITAEPVFAVLFAVWLVGQRFGLSHALGAAIILGALMFHEACLPRPVPVASAVQP